MSVDLEPTYRPSRPEPERDRWDRALLLTPSGERKPYTRVSTLAKTLDDKEGLTNWKQRTTTVGLKLRPDLWALACSIQDPEGDDKPEMRKIVNEAADVGDVAKAANQGTARHKFTEAIERGVDPAALVMVPEVRADVEAYFAELDRLGLKVRPEYSEQHYVREEFDHNGCGLSGTGDNVLETAEGLLVMADKKTSQSLKYAILSWTVQLACYANMEASYDVRADREGRDPRGPMPAVDKDMALVLWLPTGHGRLQVYELDIRAGWEYAHLAVEVRRARARGKVDERMERCLAKLYDPHEPRQLTLVPALPTPEELGTQARQTLAARAAATWGPVGTHLIDTLPADGNVRHQVLQRVGSARHHRHERAQRLNERLKSMSPEAQGLVVSWWSQWNERAEAPIRGLTDPDALHTVADLDRIEGWANEAEAETQEDLTAPDVDVINARNLMRWFPGTIDEGTVLDDAAQAALQANMALWCPPEWHPVIVDWLDDAERCGRTWRLSECPTTRRATLYELAANLANVIEGDRSNEDLALAVLVSACGWDERPEVPIGFALAMLTIEEAQEAIKVAYQVPMLALHYRSNGCPFLGPVK